MEDSRVAELIAKHGLPPRDLFDLPPSTLTFPDGAHYRNEISGIVSLEHMNELVDEMNKRRVPVHRVIYGEATTHTTSELRELARIANENRIEIVMDPGIKASHDIGRHFETPFGKLGGYRVRGADNLRYLVSSIVRCLEVGFRAFLLYDEGALYLMSKMRKAGDIPSDTIFKISYTAGHRNPAGARLLEELGADSFNPVTDLELPMLAALRKTVTIPMDIVIFGWETLGSFSRVSQSPEIVRVAAPCYLKQELHGDSRTKVKYCEIIAEMMHGFDSRITVSQQGPDDLRVPVV